MRLHKVLLISFTTKFDLWKSMLLYLDILCQVELGQITSPWIGIPYHRPGMPVLVFIYSQLYYYCAHIDPRVYGSIGVSEGVSFYHGDE